MWFQRFRTWEGWWSGNRVAVCLFLFFLCHFAPFFRWIILCSALLMVRKQDCERRLVREDWSLSGGLFQAPECFSYVHNCVGGKLKKNNNCVSRLMNRVQDHPDRCHQTISYSKVTLRLFSEKPPTSLLFLMFSGSQQVGTSFNCPCYHLHT